MSLPNACRAPRASRSLSRRWASCFSVLACAVLAAAFAPRAGAAEPRTDLRPDAADLEKSELSFEDEVHGVRAAGKDFEVTFNSHQLIVRASKPQAEVARKLKAEGKTATVTVSLVTSRIVRIEAVPGFGHPTQR